MAMKRTAERLEHVTQHMRSTIAPTVDGRFAEPKRWDLVLANGRVIDPASGTDAILNVAIAGDRIAAVGPADEVDPEELRRMRRMLDEAVGERQTGDA